MKNTLKKIKVWFGHKINRVQSLSVRNSIAVLKGDKRALYWSHTQETSKNFGDAINPLLFRHVFGHEPVSAYTIINPTKKNTYFLIGSILDNLSKENAVICGAGFMTAGAKVRTKPAKVLAVRGPLTRRILLRHDIECDEVYCDPALLLPEIYPARTDVKEFDVGLLFHYVDKPCQNTINIVNGDMTYHFIDVESEPKVIVDKICKSSFIFSSSLHGVIVAHAYGVPAVWIKISDKIVGEDFKFSDYFLAVRIENQKPLMVEDSLDLNMGIAMATCPDITNNIAMFKRSVLESKLKQRI